MRGLTDALTGLLNEYSCENESNTPDFILAHFLIDILAAFNQAVRKRGEWYDEKEERKVTEQPQGEAAKLLEELNEVPVPLQWNKGNVAMCAVLRYLLRKEAEREKEAKE